MESGLSIIATIYIVVMSLSFVSFLISPYIAWRKGFAPYYWLFAAGPIGLIVIWCFKSTRQTTTPEQLERLQSLANTCGAVLTGATFLSP